MKWRILLFAREGLDETQPITARLVPLLRYIFTILLLTTS